MERAAPIPGQPLLRAVSQAQTPLSDRLMLSPASSSPAMGKLKACSSQAGGSSFPSHHWKSLAGKPQGTNQGHRLKPRSQEFDSAGEAVEMPSPYLQALHCCSPRLLSGLAQRGLWAGEGAAEVAQ